MIVAGFGFTSRATLASFQGAFAAAGSPRVTALATLADKAGALAPLGRTLGVPVVGVSPPLPDTPTRSLRSLAARATGSVAEGAALAAAGPGARLRGPRAVSPDGLATCAIAEKDLE